MSVHPSCMGMSLWRRQAQSHGLVDAAKAHVCQFRLRLSHMEEAGHGWAYGERALLLSYWASALYRRSPSRLPQSIWLPAEMELTLMMRSLTCRHDRACRLGVRWAC